MTEVLVVPPGTAKPAEQSQAFEIWEAAQPKGGGFWFLPDQTEPLVRLRDGRVVSPGPSEAWPEGWRKEPLQAGRDWEPWWIAFSAVFVVLFAVLGGTLARFMPERERFDQFLV